MGQQHESQAMMNALSGCDLENIGRAALVAFGQPNQCANERCGAWFYVQVGRATTGAYRRTGVKFCSHACAKAQTERNRRARLKRQAVDHG